MMTKIKALWAQYKRYVACKRIAKRKKALEELVRLRIHFHPYSMESRVAIYCDNWLIKFVEPADKTAVDKELSYLRIKNRHLAIV